MQPQRRFRQSLIYETCSLSGCTYPRPQATVAIRFCMDVPNIGGLLVWNLLCVTLLAPRILWHMLRFWKICVILLTSYSGTGKTVIILSLFSFGSMYEKKSFRVIHETSVSKLIVVTPQECFFFFQSLEFPGLSFLSHFLLERV